jgi:hypothetical protein
MSESIVPIVDELKAKVLEFANIARECPENLQEKCFELLLSHYLDSLSPPRVEAKPPSPTAAAGIPNPEQATPEGTLSRGQEDITSADVHLKARRFLERYGLTIDDVNQVLYKEAGQFLPLYEDLKTTKTSECQIRIAVLSAFRSAMETGDFLFDGEAVRAECQTRKCYDKANFATYFRNKAELFEGFDKYDSSSPKVQLSEEGRKVLAALIKELR